MTEEERRGSGSESGGAAPSCAAVQAELHGLLPGAALSPTLERHLAGCAACRAARAQLGLLDGLAREQAPELPEGFELALRRRLQERATAAPAGVAAHPKPARGRWGRVALAAAAVLVLVAGALLLAPRWLGSGERPSYHRLRLSIESGADFEAVLFRVELPEGVELLPATGAAVGPSPTWQSAVRRGVNEIDLPLLARRAEGIVRVEIRAGPRVFAREVRFDSRRSQSANGTEELRLAWAIGPGGER